jgi:glutamine synthetase
VPAPHSGLLEGLPDMTAVFDPSDLRPGWERGTKIAIADLHFNGDVAPLCGRSALKRAIADWQKHGLTPMVGLEAEAYVFQRGGSGEWIPYDTPGAFVYGTGPFTDPEGLIDEVWSRAIECGLPVESINGEFDPPQFELAMRYSDALSACDDMFLFRQMAREQKTIKELGLKIGKAAEMEAQAEAAKAAAATAAAKPGNDNPDNQDDDL